MNKTNNASRYGFTILETVIAIGVVATLLTAFLAIFGIAGSSLRETIDSQEADRLVAALERELSILREGEADADTKTAFDKAFRWIGESSQGNAGHIILYHYLADPTSILADGSMEPRPEGGGNSVTASAVRFVEGGAIPDAMRAEMEANSGPVFYVQTTQLIIENGGLVLGKPGIFPPNGGPDATASTSPDDYPEAAIAFMAAFHILPTNAPQYLETFTTDSLERPLFNRPMGVRR